MVQSSDKRVLTAATQIVRKGLAKITLLGDPESVSQDADRLGLDLTGINVVDHMVRLHMHLAQIEYVYVHMYPSLLVSEGSGVGMAGGHALDHTVVFVSLTGMHKTGCSGETRLILHIPSS